MPAKVVIVLGNNLCESCTQDYCVCHFICTNERSVNWGNIDFGKYLGGLDKDVRWDLLLCAQKINDISKWIQYIKWVDVDSMKGNGIPIGSTFYWWKKKAQDTEFEDDYYWQDKIALGRYAQKKRSSITGGFATVILKQTIFQVKIATDEKSTEEEHSLKELKSCLVFWCLQEEVKR